MNKQKYCTRQTLQVTRKTTTSQLPDTRSQHNTLEALELDELLAAVNNLEVAVGVEEANVTGAQEAVLLNSDVGSLHTPRHA